MITARCHPALRPILPEPRPASKSLPDWLRTMPAEVAAETLGGEVVRTLKHCPPFIDALSAGILIPLAADLHFSKGEVSWDWEVPPLPETLIARAPVGLHVPEQATGMPAQLAVNAVLKFMNFWTLDVPDGWSLLFTHPFNRVDLPFRTLSGIVDCDLFRDGYVHFPALWTEAGYTGTLRRGTPVAQVVPIRRDAAGLTIDVMTEDQIAANRGVQQALSRETGVYRKSFRH